jgi:hypothetical protein
MTTDRVETAEALTKRIRRLLRLDQPKGDQNELSLKVLPDLRSLGSVALIGGAIRDVALGGKRCFASDLDFVVYDTDRAEFAERMQSWGSVRNKFGGYAVTRFNCKVDLWHIDDTWAKTAGHVNVVRPHDLLRCTFFDWDSAIYELHTGKLTMADGYLERLRLNVMDVCLEPNPNHTGALVRALRRAAQWNASFGARLSMFAVRMVHETAWSELVSLDARAFPRPVLRYLDRDDLLRRLGDGGESGVTKPVPDYSPQMPLPLEPVGHARHVGDDILECAVA